jgi:hypothetical protein
VPVLSKNNCESLDSAGDVAWDRLLGRLNTAEVPTAVRIMQHHGQGSSGLSVNGDRSNKCTLRILPRNLVMFLIAPLLFGPLYGIIYSTSLNAIIDVVAAQVCVCVVCVNFYPITRMPALPPLLYRVQGVYVMAVQRASKIRELMFDLSVSLSSVGFSSYVQVENHRAIKANTNGSRSLEFRFFAADNR